MDLGIRENLSEEVTSVKKYRVGKRTMYTGKNVKKALRWKRGEQIPEKTTGVLERVPFRGQRGSH